ncbi:polysaccharide deacetylase [Candidatus Saccharibacteria bacterium]|nr:polysaccharide deacetylase [Candidatus Saccharibacteria bacterium]
MELRRRQVRIHIIILTALSTLVGVLLFFLIGTLLASEILNAEARTTIENPDWQLTEERIAELEREEQEAIKKAEEEAKKALEEKIAQSAGVIYLTFDDGPGDYTAALLDVLKNRGVKATFFVTGYGSDEMIKREYEEGHTVGLHTWSHKYDQVYSSIEAYFDDLAKISDRVKNITGAESKIIRFPGGSSNTISTKYDHGIRIMSILTTEVEKRGYQYFDWNISSGDAGGANTADAVYTNVVTHLKPGPNVVLQHDVKNFSVDAVDRIIEFGLSNNYVFLPLDASSFTAHHGVNN